MKRRTLRDKFKVYTKSLHRSFISAMKKKFTKEVIEHMGLNCSGIKCRKRTNWRRLLLTANVVNLLPHNLGFASNAYVYDVEFGVVRKDRVGFVNRIKVKFDVIADNDVIKVFAIFNLIKDSWMLNKVIIKVRHDGSEDISEYDVFMNVIMDFRNHKFKFTDKVNNREIYTNKCEYLVDMLLCMNKNEIELVEVN